MRQRSTGIISPYVEAGDTPRSLPAVSDFTSGAWPSAYWRRRNLGAPWLFRGSGSQIIMDVRTELGMGADGQRLWTPAVGEAIWTRLASLGAQPPVAPTARIVSGSPVPAEWLRYALWITYDGHNPLAETQLPATVRLPTAGVELPPTDGHAVTQVQLNTADLATDPFARATVDPIDVGGGPVTTPKKKSNVGKWVLALGALALLASDKKGGS